MRPLSIVVAPEESPDPIPKGGEGSLTLRRGGAYLGRPNRNQLRSKKGLSGHHDTAQKAKRDRSQKLGHTKSSLFLTPETENFNI